MNAQIAECVRTCEACPSQWEGTLTDGRHFYARYRWGTLTAGVGDDHNAAIDASITHPIVAESLGDPLDGMLDEGTMRKHVHDALAA